MSVAELKAVPLSVPAPGAAPSAVRFGLRRLFEIMTYVAIAAWAIQSYATLYEVYGAARAAFIAFFGGVICLVSVPLLMLVMRARTAIRILMIVLVAFSLRQTVLTKRLAALRQEVAAVIDYVDKYRVNGGPYPTDLSQYRFHRPELAAYIEYRDAYPVTSYEIRWHPIALDGIAHWYSPDFGHYYEDD
jgi:hypothetical protein